MEQLPHIDTSSFQLHLFQILNKLKPQQNIVVSPLSIFIALSLTMNGSKGDTLSEILKTIKSDSVENVNKTCSNILQQYKTSNNIKIANAVFTSVPIEKAFQDKCKEYKATADNLLSVEQVNSWCAEATNNKITKIIDSIYEVKLLIVNAIYYIGAWKKPFNSKLTREHKFTSSAGSVIKCKMMYMNEKIPFFEDDNCQITKLEYQENNVVAYIILPKRQAIDDFIAQTFNKDYFSDLQLQMKEIKTELFLPKFNISDDINLKVALEQMGMSIPFTAAADFGKMTKEKVFIGRIQQKTYLKVDEKGTEAAAVTKVVMTLGIERTGKMVVDKPFLFLLCNKKQMNKCIFIAKIEKI